jgi:integrase
MVIVRDVPAFVDKLRGSVLHVPALLGLLCGMRLGEVLALRWNRINLDSKVIEIREALEQTARAARLKPPKSRAGIRDITMPDSVGGRFARLSSEPTRIADAARRWTTARRCAAVCRFQRPTAVALRRVGGMACFRQEDRHAGPDISLFKAQPRQPVNPRGRGYRHDQQAPRGHAKPDITLRVYAHLFQKDDSKAAAAINAVLKH